MKVRNPHYISQIPICEKHRSFSFVAQTDSNNSFKGNLNYQDTANDINLQSTSVTFVSILSDNRHATFSGAATVKGISGYTFRVDMEDNGGPGIGVDRFRIRLNGPASYDSNAFAANGGLLTAGNIQIHK